MSFFWQLVPRTAIVASSDADMDSKSFSPVTLTVTEEES